MSAQSGREELFDSLRSITDGASLFLVANLIVNAVKFALSLVLARGLGAELYGLFALGRKISSTVLSVSTLGSDVATIKFVSGNREDQQYQRQIFGLSVVTALVASTVATVGLWTFAPNLNALTLDHPDFTTALRVFALAIPLQAATRVVTSCFKGLEMPVQKSAVEALIPLVRLVAIVVAVLLGTSLLGVVGGFALGTLLALGFAVSLLRSSTHFTPKWGLDREGVKEFYDYSVPLTFSRAGSILHKRIDVFMIGFFLAASDLAVYNVGMVLAGIIAIPLAGFNQFFPPVASRLYSEDDIETLESVFRLVTRWSITVGVLLAGPILVYRSELLSLYGSEFQAGGIVLVLFVAGQLINAASGPSNDVLEMTGHQYVVLANHWALAVANAALNYVLIQSHGIVGAAVATAGVLAATNLARVLEVWYLEDLFAYSRKLWKPLAAGGVSAAVMVLARSHLSGLPLVVGGSAAGGLAFLVVLYATGIERRDREFVVEYVGKLANDVGS